MILGSHCYYFFLYRNERKKEEGGGRPLLPPSASFSQAERQGGEKKAFKISQLGFISQQNDGFGSAGDAADEERAEREEDGQAKTRPPASPPAGAPLWGFLLVQG